MENGPGWSESSARIMRRVDPVGVASLTRTLYEEELNIGALSFTSVTLKQNIKRGGKRMGNGGFLDMMLQQLGMDADIFSDADIRSIRHMSDIAQYMWIMRILMRISASA